MAQDLIMLQELEEQNFQQSRTLTSLETGKANTEAVRTDADIRTVVDGMVGTAASNALKSTLDQKVNKENQYDDDSVRTLLALIVNANPADSSALRTALDAIAGRVKSIESELDASCGDAVCSPGSFVKTACNPGTDPAVARECDICASGKYSFGGLVNTCLTCADCNAGFHEVQACSTVSNRVCAKCTQWYDMGSGLLGLVCGFSSGTYVVAACRVQRSSRKTVLRCKTGSA
jgi:hypothetical protein